MCFHDVDVKRDPAICAMKMKLVDDGLKVLCHMSSIVNRSTMNENRELWEWVAQLFVDPV